ncbi:hypothetical protein, partial [Roseivivax halodurans]|uniref:hypothetical protein n=1 Tax=Roseivivax halodurans TaxID=93683 RepID=UPI001B7FE180
AFFSSLLENTISSLPTFAADGESGGTAGLCWLSTNGSYLSGTKIVIYDPARNHDQNLAAPTPG